MTLAPETRVAGRPRALAHVAGTVAVVLLLLSHALFFAVVPKNSLVATRHAQLSLGLGVGLALFWPTPVGAAYGAAYVTGSEVFWRMKRADVPWEFGKYAVVLVLAVGLVRAHRLRRPALPLLYFGLLLPSALLTVSGADWATVQDALSFNLSGPLALCVSILFFSSLSLQPSELRTIIVLALAPIVGIGAAAANNLRYNMPTEFTPSSNFAASGGFGPNQVSAVLGFGIVISALLVLTQGRSLLGLIALGLIPALVAQCALTFSRGGLYMAVGALISAAAVLVSDRRTRWKFVSVGVLVLAVVFGVVVPRLEALTHGVVVTRFRDTGTTGRSILMMADLKTWLENPILGSGPGLGVENRARMLYREAAHTEYTRMLAEHGLLGFGSLIALAVMCIANLRRAPRGRPLAIVVALTVYALLFMATGATRLVVFAFSLGLSFAHLVGRRSVVRAGVAGTLAWRQGRGLTARSGRGYVHVAELP